jgi:hypothetical protein
MAIFGFHRLQQLDIFYPDEQTMASAPSVYTAEPAYPILAHSLLTRPESKITDTPNPVHEAEQNDDWNLKEDWVTGIQTNNSGVFRCGAVIGFSRLRSRSKDTDEYIGQVGTKHRITVYKA